MREITALATAAMTLATLVVGCNAAIIRAPGVEDEPPPGMIDDPAAFFATDVAPILEANCTGCHADAAETQGPYFLNPASYYVSVLGHPGLVIPGDSAASDIVMKGEHRGPALNANDLTTVRRWIDAEGMGMPPIDPPDPPGPMPVATSAYPVVDGENRIPLTEVGLPGSELVFQARRINDGVNLLMDDIMFVAGTGGLSVTHPRFIFVDDATPGAVPVEDRDAFPDYTRRVDSGATGSLTLTHVIAPFPAMGSLSVQFDSAEVPATGS